MATDGNCGKWVTDLGVLSAYAKIPVVRGTPFAQADAVVTKASDSPLLRGK